MKLTGYKVSGSIEVEITPESLKAQLEEQGYEVAKKSDPPVEWVWVRMSKNKTTKGVFADNYIELRSEKFPNTLTATTQMIDKCDGHFVTDELIQAYEKLFESVEQYWSVKGCPQDSTPDKIADKIKAIKSRTAGK